MIPAMPNFLKMFVTHCSIMELAPRGGEDLQHFG